MALACGPFYGSDMNRMMGPHPGTSIFPFSWSQELFKDIKKKL